MFSAVFTLTGGTTYDVNQLQDEVEWISGANVQSYIRDGLTVTVTFDQTVDVVAVQQVIDEHGVTSQLQQAINKANNVLAGTATWTDAQIQEAIARLVLLAARLK